MTALFLLGAQRLFGTEEYTKTSSKFISSKELVCQKGLSVSIEEHTLKGN